MKFVFINNDEWDLKIVQDILDKYCVPSKIITNEVRNGFDIDELYDVEIDVMPEFYNKLCDEINPKLDNINKLEECWELPPYELKKTEKTETEPSKKPYQKILDMLIKK